MPIRFQVGISDDLVDDAQSGRLIVILAQDDEKEPRELLEEEDFSSKPAALALNVSQIHAGESIILSDQSAIYGAHSLNELKPGLYFLQALLNKNTDTRSLNAEGNLVSDVQRLRLDPQSSGTIRLTLNRELTLEEPVETPHMKFITLQSKLLSDFHHRPIFLHAGIILPRDYERDSESRYPLWLYIGTGDSDFTQAHTLLGNENHRTEFRQAWFASDAPRMIFVHLDNRGPFGSPYYVNSDNNGPYGDALTQELIPYLEAHFRLIPEPYARVISGSSTGGWSALGLQIFYPDFFSGAWAGQPDPVDFRAYMNIDIYRDKNAYVDELGNERKSIRTRWPWQHETTVREECNYENFISQFGTYRLSGADWGAWNAVFGPRGIDYLPQALWDEQTGEINLRVAAKFRSHDLRYILEKNWSELGPKLHDKLHIWVGEADTFYLERAVHLLDDFLSKAQNPPFDGYIRYGPGKSHSWAPYSTTEIMRQMADSIRQHATKRDNKTP